MSEHDYDLLDLGARALGGLSTRGHPNAWRSEHALIMYGKTVSEGQGIMMMYPPAMRDPRVFEDPETFDIRRPAPTSNLSFGHGRHLCLGANLARMELRIFFDELLRRIPNMELDPAQSPTKRRSSFIRGLTSLPVVWQTAS